MTAPVYLLLGPEKGKKEDFINNIKASLGNCDVSRFYAFEDYEEEMFAQLNNNDLFAAHKLVIFDEAQEVKSKEKTAALVKYIKAPSDCATLLMLSSDLYLDKEIMAAVPDQKNCIVKFYELFENQKEAWLSDWFSRNGLRISQEAVSAIIEKVDNNIQEFENVCSQLAVYVKTVPGRETVTYEDVEDFLTHTRKETEFTLFAYMANGKLESALECFNTLLITGDPWSGASVTASRLAVYFRRLMSVEINMTQGMRFDDAVKTKYFDSDRPVVMPKDKAIYSAALTRYSLTDVQRILALLAEYDIKVKETGAPLQRTVMERCISDIIVNKGRPRRRPEFAVL